MTERHLFSSENFAQAARFEVRVGVYVWSPGGLTREMQK